MDNSETLFPKNNKVFCPRCNHTKQLFESETKANLFIKYNANDLKYGGDTLRAYYCSSCLGWHITHKIDSKNLNDEEIAIQPICSVKAHISDIVKKSLKIDKHPLDKMIKKALK